MEWCKQLVKQPVAEPRSEFRLLAHLFPSILAAEQVTQHVSFSNGRTSEQRGEIKYKQSENDQYEKLNKQTAKKK